MPQTDDDDDDFFGDEKIVPEEKPKPKPAKEKEPEKSRFHSRYLKDAETLGVAPDEIEACKDDAELRELLKYERSKIETERGSSQQRRAIDRQPEVDPEVKPVVEEDEEYELEPGNEEKFDADIVKELKRLGKMMIKAVGGKKKGIIKELQEKIDQLESGHKAIKANSSPLVQRAFAVCDTYPKLFGTRDDRENPDSPFAIRTKMLTDYLFGTMQNQGKLTRVPEKDIPVAVAILFPGAKPAVTEDQPDSDEPPKRKTRAENWDDAGSHPATHRNGVERSGKPGGKKAAVKAAREELRRQGRHVDEDDDDDDDDI